MSSILVVRFIEMCNIKIRPKSRHHSETHPHLLAPHGVRARIQRAEDGGVAVHRSAFHGADYENPHSGRKRRAIPVRKKTRS